VVIDERRRAVIDDYLAASQEHRVAEEASAAAYERLELAPDSIEYTIDWQVKRKHEAEAALKARQASQALRRLGLEPEDVH
jgi:hypothetical protein